MDIDTVSKVGFLLLNHIISKLTFSVFNFLDSAKISLIRILGCACLSFCMLRSTSCSSLSCRCRRFRNILRLAARIRCNCFAALSTDGNACCLSICRIIVSTTEAMTVFSISVIVFCSGSISIATASDSSGKTDLLLRRNIGSFF